MATRMSQNRLFSVGMKRMQFTTSTTIRRLWGSLNSVRELYKKLSNRNKVQTNLHKEIDHQFLGLGVLLKLTEVVVIESDVLGNQK